MKLSLIGNKTKKMIDDNIVGYDLLKEHIRFNRLSRVINKEEENYLYTLLENNIK